MTATPASAFDLVNYFLAQGGAEPVGAAAAGAAAVFAAAENGRGTVLGGIAAPPEAAPSTGLKPAISF